jgi:hypothetical protein
MQFVTLAEGFLIAVVVIIQIAFVIAQFYFFWSLYDLLARRRKFIRPYEKKVRRSIEIASDWGYRDRLTWGAREMLTIPVIESYERRGPVDQAILSESLRKIIEAMYKDDGGTAVKDSQDVIRAFHKRFCSIPPFCNGGDNDDE